MIIETAAHGPLFCLWPQPPDTGEQTTLLQRNIMGTMHPRCQLLRLDQSLMPFVTPTAACDEAHAEVATWTT